MSIDRMIGIQPSISTIKRLNTSELPISINCGISNRLKKLIINHSNIIPSPPFPRIDSNYFSNGLEALGKEEDVRQLEWVRVCWDRIVFEQGIVFEHVVNWYSNQINNGGIPLPATAYRHPIDRRLVVVINGTHRMKTLRLLMDQQDVILPTVDKESVIVGLTRKIPFVPYNLYQEEQIILTQ